MGAFYFYLPELALLVSSYSGRTTISESEVMRAARAQDPVVRTARAHIIDLSDLVGTTASPAEEAATFRALGAAYVKQFGGLRTVVVAPAEHIYGQARIFDTTVELQEGGGDVGVVKSWKEAEAFLGVDLTKVREEILRRRGEMG